MMKVIHVVYGMAFGGIETMLVNIMNEQVKSIDVSLLILNDQIETSIIDKIDKRVNIVKIGRPIGSKNILYLLKFNSFLSKEKNAVIHIHHPGIIKFLFPWVGRERRCLTMHAIPTAIDIKQARSYEHIFAISKCVYKELKKYSIESKIILNGNDNSKFSTREVIFNSHKIFKIVQVGRLMHTIKGQDLSIKACSLLKEMGIRDFHLNIIGDGESRDFLQSMVKSLKLEEFVTFWGSQTQEYIANHLKDYDLFVQPSRREGFGLTVLEAMAAKIPVLVSDQEGPLEIIENGKYGFSFHSDDAEDYAKKIVEVINCNHIGTIVQDAYDNMLKKYQVKDTARNYIKEYQKIL